MESNKFDKKIKKTLESRSAFPKENTWNRLEMLLEEEENKKPNKKGFYTYGAVASLVLLVGFFFFLNQNQNVNNTILVETPIDTLIKEGQGINKNSNVKNIITIQDDIVEKEVTQQNEIVPVVVQRKVNRYSIVRVKRRNNQNTNLNSKNVDYNLIENNQEIENELLVSSVKNETKMDEGEKNLMLKNEVNDLLREALVQMDVDLKSEKPQFSTMPKNLNANANALLKSVEEELDLSFKDKMFKKIRKGIQETSTAVLNRNK